MPLSLSLFLKLRNTPADCRALLDDSSSTQKCSVWEDVQFIHGRCAHNFKYMQILDSGSHLQDYEVEQGEHCSYVFKSTIHQCPYCFLWNQSLFQPFTATLPMTLATGQVLLKPSLYCEVPGPLFVFKHLVGSAAGSAATLSCLLYHGNRSRFFTGQFVA